MTQRKRKQKSINPPASPEIQWRFDNFSFTLAQLQSVIQNVVKQGGIPRYIVLPQLFLFGLPVLIDWRTDQILVQGQRSAAPANAVKDAEP
jgi:predicted amidohydrolase